MASVIFVLALDVEQVVFVPTCLLSLVLIRIPNSDVRDVCFRAA
jgi:hypothetical protein